MQAVHGVAERQGDREAHERGGDAVTLLPSQPAPCPVLEVPRPAVVTPRCEGVVRVAAAKGRERSGDGGLEVVEVLLRLRLRLLCRASVDASRAEVRTNGDG